MQEFHISVFCGTITLAYLIIKNYRQENIGSVILTVESAARFGITPRETKIINLLPDGISNKEIVEKLFVSPRTVEAISIIYTEKAL